MEKTTKEIRKIVDDLTYGRFRIAKVGKNGKLRAVKGGVNLINEIMSATVARRFPGMQKNENLRKKGVRVVDRSSVRLGAYISPGAVLMPNTVVNIGAWVGENTMIDSGATVGAGAQIGSNAHISGKVSIGGVLEPRQKKPVIIEDDCFIGALCSIAEGTYIGKGSVLAVGTVINSAIKIYDVRTGRRKEVQKGFIPPHVLVVPGSYQGVGGLFYNCAIIMKNITPDTKNKTKINVSLRYKKK